MGSLWEPVSNQWQHQEQLRKVLRQTIASIVIFFLVWGIFQFETPFMAQVQGTIRAWFTLDYDLEPVLRFITEVGIWGDTMERAAFEVTSLPDFPEPFTIPVSGQIGIPFGWIIRSDQTRFFHDGISIIAAEGTPIKAAIGGTVSRLANEEALGRVVVISSAGGVITRYAHCKEIFVDINEEIQAGQVIGKVGKTGSAVTYPQLLFSVSRQGHAVDPAQLFLPSANRV